MLVVTSFSNSRTFLRNGIRTTHEEDDDIIVQHMVRLTDNGSPSITLMYDDTYVFVVLIHLFNKKQLLY